MAGPTPDLRQRKKTGGNSVTTNNKKKSIKQTSSEESKNKKAINRKATTSNADPAAAAEPTETLFQTFTSHPLVRVSPFVVIPYLLYHLIYFVTLKHPEWVSSATLGFIQLRAPLAWHEARQVLIIGPEIAQNRNVATGLAQKATLHVEVALEAMDASNYFCRDGTVSWFQIMRFLEPWEQPPPLNHQEGEESSWSNDTEVLPVSKYQELQFQSWNRLCMNRTDPIVTLFHPKFHRETSCSTREVWSSCWAKECLSAVSSMWGCAWKSQNGPTQPSDGESSSSCLPPFERVLHLTRHPLRTIETLNATYCETPTDSHAFLELATSWFPLQLPPPHQLGQPRSKTDPVLLLDWTQLSCLESMAMYVLQFHSTMLRAQDAGLVHGRISMESTSPCQVAQRAGFLESYTSLYEPHTERLASDQVCPVLDTMVYVDPTDEAPPLKQLGLGFGTPKVYWDARNFKTFSKIGTTSSKQKTPLETVILETFVDSPMLLQESLRQLITLLGYDAESSSEFA
jgi:hypothetical protein